MIYPSGCVEQRSLFPRATALPAIPFQGRLKRQRRHFRAARPYLLSP